MRRVVVLAGLFPTYHTHLSRVLRALNFSVVVVSGQREEFVIDALQRVQRHGGYVLSGRERVARQVKELLSRSCHDASPPLSAFRAFDGAEAGKTATMKWLRENGLADYAIERFSSTNLSDSHFPLIVKPVFGFGGHGVQLVKTRATLTRLLANNGRYILERPIYNDTEWGVHFTAHSGRRLSTACVRMNFKGSMFIRSHRARAIKSIDWRECPSELRLLATRIVQKSNYTGFGCAGIKYVSDLPRVIEVNPRVCGMLVKRNALLREHLETFASRMETTCPTLD